MDDLRETVRAEMTRKGLSQAALAREAGITQSQISLWLTGKQDLYLGTFSALTAALSLEVRLKRRR